MKLRALLAVPLAVLFQLAVPATAHASGCTPIADSPFLSGGKGYAHVQTTGCSGVTYHYEVRFASSTGTPISDYTVDGASGNIDATAPLFNTLANCAGQGVRSFIYINVGGVGKSAQNPPPGWVSC
jgi:hypothetical protein